MTYKQRPERDKLTRREKTAGGVSAVRDGLTMLQRYCGLYGWPSASVRGCVDIKPEGGAEA